MLTFAPSSPWTKVLDVALGDRSYPIWSGHALPGAKAAEEALRLRGARGPGRVLVVSDSNVAPRYADDMVGALRGAGFDAALAVVPAGEGSKSLPQLGELVDLALGQVRLGRRDLVVALGGGVVGDLAGFLAAVLHRGVRWIGAPTSLLAQVDSSVGGKTAVNHLAGKNLIGAFHQPSSVVSSSLVLQTLPEREVRCGLAEAVKHGFLMDPDLVARCVAQADALRALEPGPIASLVADCCRIKAAVVASDERERGDGPVSRELLNLGHTFGHAYERLAGFGTLTHGEAVALGTVLAARLSERFSGTDDFAAAPGLARDVRQVLRALGLPEDPDAPDRPTPTQLVEAAKTDKKADGDTVRFVLLERFGRARVAPRTWSALHEALTQGPTDFEVAR